MENATRESQNNARHVLSLTSYSAVWSRSSWKLLLLPMPPTHTFFDVATMSIISNNASLSNPWQLKMLRNEKIAAKTNANKSVQTTNNWRGFAPVCESKIQTSWNAKQWKCNRPNFQFQIQIPVSNFQFQFPMSNFQVQFPMPISNSNFQRYNFQFNSNSQKEPAPPRSRWRAPITPSCRASRGSHTARRFALRPLIFFSDGRQSSGSLLILISHVQPCVACVQTRKATVGAWKETTMNAQPKIPCEPSTTACS